MAYDGCGCGQQTQNDNYQPPTLGGSDGLQLNDIFGPGEKLGLVEALQLLASLATIVLLIKALNE